MTDNNLTPDDLLAKKEFQSLLDKSTYTLTSSQYDDLSRLAALYESLHTLLEPFESDSPLSSISCLFNHLNESLFEYIDTLNPEVI